MTKGQETIELPAPLPADLEALLEHERAILPVRKDVEERLTAKARAALSSGGADTSALSALVGALHPLGIAALAGVGVVFGLALTFQAARHAKSVALPPEPSAPVPSLVVSATPDLAVAPTAPAASPPVEVLHARSSERRSSVLEELRLLDVARRAYMSGDFSGVLANAAEHERLFPNGRLAEDRELLRLRAFVGLGRQREARVEASKFRRMFPRSVLLPRIDDLLASTR